MALAIDASTPAVATATSGSTVNATVTSCPAGAVLAVLTVHNTTSGNSDVDATISDDKSLTWTQKAKRYEGDAGGSAGMCALSWARNGGSTQTIVVTGTGTGTGIRGEIAMYVLVFTGAKSSGDPFGAVAEASSDNTDNLTVSIVTTADGSIAALGDSDWWAETTYVGGTGFTDDAAGIVNGNIGYWICHKTAIVTTSGTTVTFDPTNATHTARNNAIAFEVLAAVTAAAGPPMQPARRPLWQWPRLPWLRRRIRSGPPLPISPPPLAAYNPQGTRLAIRRLFVPRRGRAPAAPVPISPPPAAAYNLQRTRSALRRLLSARRARAAGPLPTAVVVVPSWLPIAVRPGRRPALPARRVRPAVPPTPPVPPPPAACRPIRRPLPAVRRARSFAPPLPPPPVPPAAARERIRPPLPARRLLHPVGVLPAPDRPPATAARRLRVPLVRCRLRAASPPFVVVVTPPVVTTPGSLTLTTAAASGTNATAVGTFTSSTAAAMSTSTSVVASLSSTTSAGSQTPTTSGGGP